MDNQIFNVNGKGQKRLEKAIALWYDPNNYMQDDSPEKLTFQGYAIDPERGFILLKYVGNDDKGAVKFPVPINIEIAVGMVYAWLKSDDGKKIPLADWEDNVDIDGSTSWGWRVYVEGWGHVGDFRYGAVAIKSVYLWYGK